MKYNAPENLKALARIFRSNSYPLYLVGGAVRDYILKRENHDYDLTSSATPEEIKSMFRRTIDTGIKHGTVTVIFNREHYEITTFRTEGGYSDSRHPDSVKFVSSLDEDLKRRDFTINALASDILTGEIIDNHNGIEDLERKTIRAIGEAEERFTEDALRMLRACRFASKLGFTIEEKTLEAVKKLHENILKISIERIKDELDGILLSPDPVRGLGYMEETGLREAVLPEVETGEEKKTSLMKAAESRLPLASMYAILFSGLESREIEKILTRLKSSNREKSDVLLLSSNLHVDTSSDPVEIRRFIKRIGKEKTDDYFNYRRASGFDRDEDLDFEENVKKELIGNPALEIKDLRINGSDLKNIVTPGPEMGRMLSFLLDKVIENPSLNERDKLLALLTRGS